MKDPLSKWEENQKEETDPPLIRVFHWFMVTLGLAIVFAIGGTLLFLQSNRHASTALHETPTSGIVRFCIGGATAVGIVLYFYFRKQKHVI